MPKAFGFNDDELKLLLVAVRHMRRTFAQAEKATPQAREAVADYAALYNALLEKLRDMVGAVPENLDEIL